jgi:hypothetical protein
MNRIIAPFAAPQKVPGLQGKSRRVGGPCPLGAAMDSSAFTHTTKYCHNGGLAFAHQSPALQSRSRAAQPGARVPSSRSWHPLRHP